MRKVERIIIMQTTVARKEDARKMSDVLLGGRLAACIQIVGPIESRYWWRGKTSKSGEFLVLIKTAKKNYKKIESIIGKMHDYENPEILALSVSHASKLYLSWLSSEIR